MRFFEGPGEASLLHWKLSAPSFWHFNYQKLMTHKHESCTGTGVNVSTMRRCYLESDICTCRVLYFFNKGMTEALCFCRFIREALYFTQSRELCDG